MTDRATGVSAALEALLSDARTAGGDADQPGLFEDDAGFESDLGAPLAIKPNPNGGRPKGARNKSTEAVREYINRTYGNPLIVAAKFWVMTPIDIAKELQLYTYQYFQGDEVAKHLDVGSAARLQAAYVAAAMPYLAQKMPIEIAQKGEKRGLLVLGDLNVTQVAVDSGLPLAPLIDVTPHKDNAA